MKKKKKIQVFELSNESGSGVVEDNGFNSEICEMKKKEGKVATVVVAAEGGGRDARLAINNGGSGWLLSRCLYNLYLLFSAS